MKQLSLSPKKRLPLHTCHWPGCTVEVPPRLWGCRAHWFKLPAQIRKDIWAAYRPGQENDESPDESYLIAVRKARDWIKKSTFLDPNTNYVFYGFGQTITVESLVEVCRGQSGGG